MSYNQNYYNQPDLFGAGNWSNWDNYWSNTWGDYYNQQPAWNPSQPTGTGNVPITPEPQVTTNVPTATTPDTNIDDTNIPTEGDTNVVEEVATNWWTNAFGESGMVNIPGFGNINLSNIRYYESVPQPIRAWLEYVVNSQRAYWPNPWQPPIIHMQPHPNY